MYILVSCKQSYATFILVLHMNSYSTGSIGLHVPNSNWKINWWSGLLHHNSVVDDLNSVTVNPLSSFNIPFPSPTITNNTPLPNTNLSPHPNIRPPTLTTPNLLNPFFTSIPPTPHLPHILHSATPPNTHPPPSQYLASTTSDLFSLRHLFLAVHIMWTVLFQTRVGVGDSVKFYVRREVTMMMYVRREPLHLCRM